MINNINYKETIAYDDYDNFLGNFIILKTLYHSSEKTIYTVFDKINNRCAALSITCLYALDEEKILKVMRESRINAILDHDNIVPLYKSEIIYQHFFKLNKYIDGKNLNHALMQRKHRKTKYYRFIFKCYKSVLDAIKYAHNKGIVHLDINPNNIMVAKNDDIFLLDWGISKIIKDIDGYDMDKSLNEQCCLGGTMKFMAPEQCLGNVGILNKETDYYLLGALLYYLVTHKSLIKCSKKKLFIYTQENLISINEVDIFGNKIDPIIIEIIKKCCSTHQEDRYSDIHELLYEFNMSVNIIN